MPLHPEYSATNVGCFGCGGSGKTTWAARYLRATDYQARFLFDPLGSLSRYCGVNRQRTEAGLVAALRTGWAAYDPAAMFPADYEAGAAWFATFCLLWGDRLSGRKCFAADELGRYLDRPKLPPAVQALVLSGRNYATDFLMLSQHPLDLPPKARNQLTLAVAFTSQEPGALEWFAGRGFDRDAVARLRPASLRKPPCGEFLVRSQAGATYAGALYPGAVASPAATRPR
jgi:hypothetical protein